MKNLFKKISHINLLSKKNKELISFYRDVLEIKPLEGQDLDSKWFGFATEGTTFAVEPQSNRDNYNFDYNEENPILIQFAAENIHQLEEMNKYLESKGIKILRRSEKKTYGTITNFVDPDGNVIEILCENDN